MHDLTKADEIYNKMSTDEKVNKTFKIFKEQMPEEYCNLMYIMEYGCHIATKEMYDKAVSLFDWVDDKGSGAKWSVDEIVRSSGIDFDSMEHKEKKKFTKFDYAYVVNMLYSDNCNVGDLTSSGYLKMAKNYLTDKDPADGCDASERAYKDAKERIKNYY